MDSSIEIKIIKELPEHLYHQTAEIIYEAFGRKINCIIRPKDKAILILERSINPELGFFAISKVYLDTIFILGAVQYEPDSILQKLS